MQKLTRVKLKKVSVYIVLHHRCGIYRMTPPRSQGPLQRKVWEIVKGRSWRNEVKLSSGHYRVSAFMNSQQMQLPAQDLHKIKPIRIPVWTGEGTQMNKTCMRSSQPACQHKMGRERVLKIARPAQNQPNQHASMNWRRKGNYKEQDLHEIKPINIPVWTGEYSKEKDLHEIKPINILAWTGAEDSESPNCSEGSIHSWWL